MTFTPSTIAAAIADAPAWALIGLTMPDPQMRERGAEELARWIAERIGVSTTDGVIGHPQSIACQPAEQERRRAG